MPKLINKTRFTKFANDLWDKIKRKYDNAFKEATISASDSADKKITLTRVSGATVDVNLQDYARLQDRNEFKKDVSVDDAGYADNSKMGQATSTVNPSQRTIGARNLSSALFTDGFVSKLRVYVADSVTTNPYIHIWAINKKSTKTQDTTNEKLAGGSVQIHGEAGNKYIDIPINKTFTNDVYFVLRTSESSNFKAIDNIDPSFAGDVINLVDRTPPNEANRPLIWDGAITTTTGKFELYGRMGIVDLNKKVEKVSADTSLYVKHSETTATGGNGHAGKVAKLGDNGKLDATMLPSIAINEYIEISEFTNDVLRSKTYENGDTVVVTGATDTGARYLCINKDGNNLANLTDAFIKLNDKDGVVTGVNDKTGAVVLNLEATENSLKLKIGNGSGTDVEKSVDIISDAEIEAIINGLN